MGTTWSGSSGSTDSINNSKKLYGWKKDIIDERDNYHNFKDIVKENLPVDVDLRKGCPEIYNQGNLGSCTANAIAAAYQYDEILQGEKEIMTPSRLFIYYNEREQEGHVSQDAGASLRDGMKTISKIGVCSEKSWPYLTDCFADRPKTCCYQEAKYHCAVTYRRVPQSITAMKACLNGGLPFVFGFQVFESFESKEVEETGIMSMPASCEKSLGGHAVMAVGYSDRKKCMIVRNSWGPEWGEGGYFYMPYKFIKDPEYCQDFWTIRKVHDVACGEDIVLDIKETEELTMDPVPEDVN